MSKQQTSSKRCEVCPVEELPPGQRKIIEVEGRSIGVFNVHGELYAIRNVCPHQMAPLCLGKVTGTTLPSRPGEYHWAHDGQIIRCPWHGWEFNITTGKSVFNPHKMRVKSYEVNVEPVACEHDTCQPTVDQPDTPDPELERYPVQVERQMVVVYL